jgi:GNAT superfamily N-acetyltransferase
MELIYDYRDITEYRSSFNELAGHIFGIDFEGWYNKGGWNDRYVCYSYINKTKVVANVSISKMDVIINGEDKKALQIGTVMTHPDYRNKGLSARLMKHVLEKYEKDYDFIYLFANKEVVNFYPKFGFAKLKESQFSVDFNMRKSASNLRKLNISDINDFNILKKLALERIPVSGILGIKNDWHILLFHCLYSFHNHIYYMEDDDIIAIFKETEDRIDIYDVISRQEFSLSNILNSISSVKKGKVFFHFTPDLNDITCNPLETTDTLFIKPVWFELTEKFFPITSRA